MVTRPGRPPGRAAEAAPKPRAQAGGGPREVSRAELERAAGPVPRVVLLCGGDPVLAREVAEALAARVVAPGLESFNRDTLQASEVPLRDLVSRVQELPMLSPERCLVVRGAEALLKQPGEALAPLWPGPESSTVLILLAADEEARPTGARRGAPRWAEVLPGHAVRVAVGGPTAADAVRWGRQAAREAGAELPDEAFRAAFQRARGDGARLRTGLEQAVLAALCGRGAAGAGGGPEPTLEEAETRLLEALAAQDWRAVWPAAERFRALGGRMDSSGAAWVRRAAERAGTGSPGAVAALRALSTLQLRWRREVGTARRVLETSALELALTRVGRKENA
ncbi:MAG TPA: hypothetical protein VMS93_02065 [Candidatus Saccharimonadales bacterium]|nr:hypothetical protein [Candidatus Saccharimonadales bacterium]